MSNTPDPGNFREIRPGAAPEPPSHLASPEAVVAELYALLSGPAESEEPRDWERFRALLLPDARFLICHGWDDEGRRTPGLREWDVDGFVADARLAYRSEGFWEREIAGRTERFGGVAHRFSSYESRIGSPNSEPVGRGINSIQLVRSGGRWWIASVVWDTESPDQPLPAPYAAGRDPAPA